MMMRTMVSLLLLALPMAGGAESVTEVSRQSNGTYLLKIDGKQYVALSQKDNEQLLGEVEALQQKLEESLARLQHYQALTNQYDELKNKYVALTGDYKTLSEDSLRLSGDFSTTAGKLVALNQDYSRLVQDYDTLTEKYRDIAVRSHPRSPFDVGVGALRSNDHTYGIAMVGAGTRLLEVDMRAWLFGGEQSYGLIVGAAF